MCRTSYGDRVSTIAAGKQADLLERFVVFLKDRLFAGYLVSASNRNVDIAEVDTQTGPADHLSDQGRWHRLNIERENLPQRSLFVDRGVPCSWS
ncbi:hypothetical protein [Sphingomonas sp. YL-JM2C]